MSWNCEKENEKHLPRAAFPFALFAILVLY